MLSNYFIKQKLEKELVEVQNKIKEKIDELSFIMLHDYSDESYNKNSEESMRLYAIEGCLIIKLKNLETKKV